MLPVHARERLAGVGLALPRDGTNGQDEGPYFGALQDEIEAQLGISVFIQNDVTAAASGESMFGVAKPLTNYMFFYLGAKLHGRLVLNHQIYKGNSALSFDVGISALEAELASRGRSLEPLSDRSGDWSAHGEFIETWEKSSDRTDAAVDFRRESVRRI